MYSSFRRDAARQAWGSDSLSHTLPDYSVESSAASLFPDDDATSTLFSARGLSTQDLLGLRPSLSQRPNLTKIDLCNNNIWDRGVQAVADAIRNCPALTTVIVSTNSIGSAGIVALADALQQSSFGTVKELDVRGNRAGNVGADALAKMLKSLSHRSSRSGAHGLTNLDISSNFLRSEGVTSLVEALPIYGKLRVLDVSMNFLQADGGVAIANVLAGNPGLAVLRMNSCYIRGEGGCAIARALKRNTQLEELGLADNYLDAKALTEFGNAVEVNSTLKTLNLSGVHKRSDILEDGGSSSRNGSFVSYRSTLGRGLLEDSRLLNVSRASFKDSMMPTSSVDSGSAISDTGATLLARGLASNKGLTALVLSSNGITDAGVSAICDAIRAGNCPLQSLDLSENPGGSKGVASIIAAAQDCTSLIEVALSGWSLPSESARTLGTVLAKHIELHRKREFERQRSDVLATSEAKLSDLQATELSVVERTATSQAAVASDGARLAILRKEQVLLQEEERALSLAKQDLDSKATAVQQNCNRMDAELSRAEEERRIIEQQLLIVQGDVELVKARVEAMKRQIQNDTGTVIEMESSTVRTSARVGECKVKIEAALKKLDDHAHVVEELRAQEAKLREEMQSGEQRASDLVRLAEVEKVKLRESESDLAVAEARAAEAIRVQTLIRARLDELMQQRSLQETAAAKASSELSEAKRRVTAHQTRIASLDESYRQSVERKRKLEVQIIEETSELEQLTITFEQSQLRASSAVAEAQRLETEELSWRQSLESAQALLQDLDKRLWSLKSQRNALQTQQGALTEVAAHLVDEISLLRQCRELVAAPPALVKPALRHASIQVDETPPSVCTASQTDPMVVSALQPVAVRERESSLQIHTRERVDSAPVMAASTVIQTSLSTKLREDQEVVLSSSGVTSVETSARPTPKVESANIDDVPAAGSQAVPHPKANLFAEILHDGSLMRAKPNTASSFAYCRVYSNAECTTLFVQATEKGEALQMIIPVSKLGNVSAGLPAIVPKKAGVCGSKALSMDSTKVLQTTCFTVGFKEPLPHEGQAVPTKPVTGLDLQVEHEDVRADWMAAVEWMRDGAPGLAVGEHDKAPPATVSPAESAPQGQPTGPKPNTVSAPGVALPRQVPVPIPAPSLTKAVALRALGEFDDDAAAEEQHNSTQAMSEDDFDYESKLPDPPTQQAVHHHPAVGASFPVAQDVAFATPTLPFALSINTTGGIGAPTPVTTAVPVSAWQSAAVSKPVLQPQAQQHVIPAPSHPPVMVSAPPVQKTDEGEEGGDGSDLGPEKWSQRDITVLRDQLWELIRNIPPEQEVLPTYKELREEVTQLMGLNLSHKGWRKWFRVEIDGMFARLDEEAAAADADLEFA